MARPLFWRRLEGIGVVLVALHSLLIGAALMLATDWVLDFAGWQAVTHNFFPRQSGVFHLVVAVGYLWEYRRYGEINLMILAKSSAVVFLLIASPWQEAWSVPFSGVLDGLMLVGMFVVHRLARTARSST